MNVDHADHRTKNMYQVPFEHVPGSRCPRFHLTVSEACPVDIFADSFGLICD